MPGADVTLNEFFDRLNASWPSPEGKPTVFKSGTSFDFRNQYTLPLGGNAAQKFSSYFLNAQSGIVKVYILDLFDATNVRLTGFLNNTGTTIEPFFICYALSETDNFTPVPAEQFSLMNDGASGIAGTPGVCFLHDEIPCAGNRYLHIFGGVFVASNTAIDAFSTNFNATGLGGMFTYALIK